MQKYTTQSIQRSWETMVSHQIWLPRDLRVGLSGIIAVMFLILNRMLFFVFRDSKKKLTFEEQLEL